MVQRASQRGNERGALAVWTSVALVAFILCVGLGVDLAGHAAAEQEARAVANQAARAGGQDIELTAGGTPRLARTAVGTAERYFSTSGYSGTASIEAGNVQVRIQGSYETTFLGIIGVDVLRVQAQAVADPILVVGGEPQ